jgi:hypothetical protein
MSQIREEFSGEESGIVLNFAGGFFAGKEDLNGIIRLEQGGSRTEKSLDIVNFGPLAIALADILKI